MTTTTASPEATFSMGTVASETFDSIGNNFVIFGILALIAAVPEQLLAYYVSKNALLAPQVLTRNFGQYFGVFTATWLLQFVMNFLLQAAIANGTIVYLNGQRASLGKCLSTALRALLPLIAITILAMLGFAAGLILLIVPGIILLVGWSLVTPVRVVENTGIIETLGRSWSLTSGHKWKIFALFLIFGVGASLVSALGAAIAGVTVLDARAILAGGLPVMYFVVTGIFRAVYYMVSAAGITVIYYQLRMIKEGVGPEQLAALFD